MPSTIGIDVGASRKGYHAVALSKTTIAAKFHSRDPVEIARWCIARSPAAIAIDAPCRWRPAGAPARAAELELARKRISCFSTPTEEKARGHAFYTWMFAGHALYAALAAHYPLYPGPSAAPSAPASLRPIPLSDRSIWPASSTDNLRPSARFAFETFPHAIACALAGCHIPAKEKLVRRTELLRRYFSQPAPTARHSPLLSARSSGVTCPTTCVTLSNIDEIDAALCAVAAQHFANNTTTAYGNAATGFIIVPRDPLAATSSTSLSSAPRATAPQFLKRSAPATPLGP